MFDVAMHWALVSVRSSFKSLFQGPTCFGVLTGRFPSELRSFFIVASSFHDN